MPSRTRSRDRSATSSGKIDLIYNGVVYSTTPGYAGSTWHETCDDTTDVPPFVVPHPLTITSLKASPPMKVYGTEPYAPLPILHYVYDGYTVANRAGYSYCPSMTPVNWAFWQTKALAGLNPAAPAVDLLNFVYEFKDLPEMLRNLGHVLNNHRPASSIPNGVLAFQFGWKPLVSDLLSLWHIADEVEKRCAYLRKLEHGTYFRRTLFSGRSNYVYTANAYNLASSDGVNYIYRFDEEIEERRSVWFTANAKLLTPLPSASEDMRRIVRNQLLGLTLDAVPGVVWNAIPWTWLLDYFGNFSDFMVAQRGNYVLSIPSMCIMARTEVTSLLKNDRVKGGFTVSGGRRLSTIAKQRYVVYQPVPWLSYDPILSDGQKINLGALFFSRSSGYAGRLGK